MVFAGPITALLASTGFRLRKLVSSHKEVLKVLPKSELASSTLEIESSKSVPERTLGFEWDVTEEKLKFTFITQVKPRTRWGCQWSHKFSTH